MDWFTLVDQVLSQEKESARGLQDPEETDDGSPDGNELSGCSLDAAETTALLSIMNITSLQLYVLHARMPGSIRHSEITSAKKLYEIIKRTMSELETDGTFSYLHSTVKKRTVKRRADDSVTKSVAESDKRIRDLRLEIKSNDKIKAKDISKKQEIVASLKDDIQNLIATTESNLRYVDRWENAQRSKNHFRCENLELKLKWELDTLRDVYVNEITVNDKICGFLSAQIQGLEDDLRDWGKRYEEEMKRRKDKIGQLHEKASKQRFRLQELQQLFNARENEIRDYLKFKEEKRREEERNRFIYESATKIQAWWRGTMVRRGLGPYKKRKKLAKDKKKKKN